jgi:hypothetical protein
VGSEDLPSGGGGGGNIRRGIPYFGLCQAVGNGNCSDLEGVGEASKCDWASRKT